MGCGKYSDFKIQYCQETEAQRNLGVSEHAVGMDTSLTVYNDSSSEIIVKNRMGVSSFIPAGKPFGTTADKVLIRLQWFLNRDSLRYTIRDLEHRYPRPSPLIKTMLRSFSDALESASGNSPIRTTPIWIEIPSSDIRRGGGRVYLEELDLTIAFLEDNNKEVDHPFSPAQRARQTLGTLAPAIGRETMFFMIKAVDNGKCKSRDDRYIWIGNDVFHIPVEYDPLMNEGITVICHGSATRKNDLGSMGNQPVSMLLTFEEADELLGLSKTIEGAKQRGNSKEVLAERLATTAQASKLREMELSMESMEIKHQRDMEKIEQERAREADKLAAERERARMDSHKREYESRKARQEAQRDDVRSFTEWVRLAGTVITAGLAFAAIVQKIKAG